MYACCWMRMPHMHTHTCTHRGNVFTVDIGMDISLEKLNSFPISLLFQEIMVSFTRFSEVLSHMASKCLLFCFEFFAFNVFQFFSFFFKCAWALSVLLCQIRPLDSVLLQYLWDKFYGSLYCGTNRSLHFGVRFLFL